MPFLQSSDLESVYEFSLTLPIASNTSDATEAAESLLFETFFADSSVFTERWAASNGGLANLRVSPWVRLLSEQLPADSSSNSRNSSSSSAASSSNDEGSVSDAFGDGSTAGSTDGSLSDASGDGSTASSTEGSVDSSHVDLARRPLQREQTFDISAGLHGVHSCRVRAMLPCNSLLATAL